MTIWILTFLLVWTAIISVPFAWLYFKRYRDEANHLPPMPEGSILGKSQNGAIR